MDLNAATEEQYAEFASYADSSPTYQRWARAVSQDAQVVEWINTLPRIKRQPNLVLAAVRWHGVPTPGLYAGFRDALLNDGGAIRATIMARRTQTNEVGRLATLMPAFYRIWREGHQPLALLEVGASAGLCLYPDRYDYRWHARDQPGTVHSLHGSGGPELTCTARQPSGARVTATWPTAYPVIAYRCGIDLNPLDVTDPDAMAWLTNLVWPEEDRRRERLAAAIDLASADPPQIVAGDLLDLLPQQVERASAYGEVVVFHSAVIAYLEPARQLDFHTLMSDLVARGACRWVSNEDKHVLPSVTATGPPIPPDHPTFVLALDGQVLAWTHGHGSSMTRLD